MGHRTRMTASTTPDRAVAPTAAAHPVGPTTGPLTFDELRMAFRCPEMPLDALAFDETPVGLHYYVVHFDIPVIDPSTWQLEIGGLVREPVSLDLDAIRSMPAVDASVTLECAGNGRALMEPRPVSGPWLTGGVSNATWTGVPLATILEEVGVEPGAVDVVFTGADRGVQGGEEQDYQRALSMAEATRPDVLLAYAMNGGPLPPQHGFPLRLLVPGWYGMTSVKWLRRIEVTGERFDGFQHRVAYRFQRDADDPGVPVSRIRVKSLIHPPGVAVFATQQRLVDAGSVRLSGRAWSGEAPIERVDVGIDGAWHEATLAPSLGPAAWVGWSLDWEATPGEHEIISRATDASGATQPLEQAWDYYGYGNNAVQRMTVTVR